MAEYKRKKVNKLFKNKLTKHNVDENIVMSNKKSRKRGIVPENNIKIVRGKKFIQKQKVELSSTFCFLFYLYVFL